MSFECSAISLFYKEIQLFIYLVGQVIYGSINANFSILYATMNVNLTLYLMLLKNTYLMLNSSKKKTLYLMQSYLVYSMFTYLILHFHLWDNEYISLLTI